MIETVTLSEQTPTPTSSIHYLPLLPLKSVVLLPRSIRPILVQRQASMLAIDYAFKHNFTMFVTAQRTAEVEYPTEQDIYEYGTRAIVSQAMRMPDGKLKVAIETVCRARLLKTELSNGMTMAHCEDIPSTGFEKEVEIEASWRYIRELYVSYMKLNARAPGELLHAAKNMYDIDNLADIMAMHLAISFDERQKFLEIVDVHERLSNRTPAQRNRDPDHRVQYSGAYAKSV